MTTREALLQLAQALPAGTPVPVPREWLLEVLEGNGGDGVGSAPVEARPTPRLLSVREAAERLAVEPQWLYRHADELPFTRRVGTGARPALRFLDLGLDEYLRGRAEAETASPALPRAG